MHQSRTGAAGRAEKAASRPLPWRALLLVTLAAAAGFALIFLTPGLDTRTGAALAFILAPVVVTLIFLLAGRVQPRFPGRRLGPGW